LIGYFLQTLRITPKRFCIALIIGIGGVAGMIGGTWMLSYAGNATNAFFMDYHSIFCYCIAVAVFIIVKYYFERKNFDLLKPKITSSLVQTLSNASFGIYLIHIIVLTTLDKLIVFPHPIVKMTFGALIVYSVSLAIILLFKKNPLIKHFIP